MNPTPPVVLVFGGSDPTGGAGLEADILTLASLGCHAAPVVTAVTAQDTMGLKQYSLVDTELVIAQARAILEDMPVAAFKTGMLGSEAMISAVTTILDQYAEVPLIVDPVMYTGAGEPLIESDITPALRAMLVPRTTLITPNLAEARTLAPDADSIDACAQELLSLGCSYALITSTDEKSTDISHRLYGDNRVLETFVVPRLPHQYHGSGCTLASACAAALAQNIGIANAVAHALSYTENSLKHAWRLGMGQYLPNRLYWAHDGASKSGNRSH